MIINHLSAGELFKKDLHSSLSSYLSVSCDVSLLTSALCTPSIYLFLGRPTGLLPTGLHLRYFGFLSSSILITCPCHLKLFLSISSPNGLTCSSSLILVLCILSLLVTPRIVLRTRISAACNFASVFIDRDFTSDSYSRLGFSILW